MPRPHWDPARLAAVAAGGALGAAGRRAVVQATGTGRFPWPVLAVNLAGSLLLGVLLAEQARRPDHHVALQDLGAIGFCGGLTTFSTFAVEVVAMIDRGDALMAAVYAVTSVAGALVAVVAGAALLHRARAVERPVEESP
jgi:CrcB protein